MTCSRLMRGPGESYSDVILRIAAGRDRRRSMTGLPISRVEMKRWGKRMDDRERRRRLRLRLSTIRSGNRPVVHFAFLQRRKTPNGARHEVASALENGHRGYAAGGLSQLRAMARSRRGAYSGESSCGWLRAGNEIGHTRPIAWLAQSRSLGPSSIPSLGDGVMLGTAWIGRPVDTQGLHSLLPRHPQCSMEVQPCSSQ